MSRLAWPSAGAGSANVAKRWLSWQALAGDAITAQTSAAARAVTMARRSALRQDNKIGPAIGDLVQLVVALHPALAPDVLADRLDAPADDLRAERLVEPSRRLVVAQ